MQHVLFERPDGLTAVAEEVDLNGEELTHGNGG